MKYFFILFIYVDYYEGFCFGIVYLLSRGYEKIGICLVRKISVNFMECEKVFVDIFCNEGKMLYFEWIFY